ncbi:MAG: PepSY domain-containing protein [Gammaproteobacteria bacterium]|nr:PepSY domain-containing protein [Gammaproteobacteria bacterium]MDH3411297.1 PepSY domain-containing protein [Gammaproteobacteria bacterium]
MNADAPPVPVQKPVRDAKRTAQGQHETPKNRTHGAVYRLVRKTHLWVAIIVALPLLLLLVTGVALQVRKPVDWIQPTTEVGVARYDPGVGHAQILAAAKAVPEMRVEDWSDIAALDYRPKNGIIKVRNHDDLETQVDAKTGEVIRTGRRWNNLIARVHDGSEWGMRLWFFLPAGLLIVYLWISGFYLAVMETSRKLRARRQRKARQEIESGPRAGVSSHRRSFNLLSFCLRYHYWLAVIVILPWMLVTSSGLVLQLRTELPGVDPGLHQGVGSTPALSYPRVLDIATTIPELQVQRWKDIWRIYTHPGEGVITVRTRRGVRAQLDASTGKVLAVEPYSRDFWEDLHEGLIGRHQPRSGSPFGSLQVDLRFWVFLPVQLIAVLLWLTGVIYFLKTTFAKQKSGMARDSSPAAAWQDTNIEPMQQPSGGD